ncbi:MAG: molybdopterin molybdenumtransferase MoeA, partial [Methanobacterium sp.]
MYHPEILNVQQTREIIRKYENTTVKELIDIKDGNSRVLAQNITVLIDVPPFDRSAMDGYSVIAEDLTNASDSQPRFLKVVD